jgi:hypothetical protein
MAEQNAGNSRLTTQLSNKNAIDRHICPEKNLYFRLLFAASVFAFESGLPVALTGRR